MLEVLPIRGDLRDSRASSAVFVLKAVLPFDDPASFQAAKVRSHLERKGLGIGPYHTLIAGHALSIPAELITANAREFSPVPGLKLGNWISPA